MAEAIKRVSALLRGTSQYAGREADPQPTPQSVLLGLHEYPLAHLLPWSYG